MAKRKAWDELAPVTRARRFEAIAANHLPKDRTVVSMASRHSKCANRDRCTGPGCRARS